jgi:AraC family transcriptional regulator of adaptative response/methylated-DNA-[protein]-cysteine methyltransferase
LHYHSIELENIEDSEKAISPSTQHNMYYQTLKMTYLVHFNLLLGILLRMFNQSLIDTPLGPMMAIANEAALYLLEFVDCNKLSWEIERLQAKTDGTMLPGRNNILQSIETELQQYFNGKLREFQTPISLLGTPFQARVWEELRKIPYGTTISYAQLAGAIGQPKASRAVGGANGKNQLAIIVPCHRVISANGTIGGYSGGIERKPKLLERELCNSL